MSPEEYAFVSVDTFRQASKDLLEAFEVTFDGEQPPVGTSDDYATWCEWLSKKLSHEDINNFASQNTISIKKVGSRPLKITQIMKYTIVRL